MNKTLNWFTRKRVILTSIITTTLFVAIYSNIPYKYLCRPSVFFGSCGDILKFLKVVFMLSPALLLLSIIIFKLKESTFLVWRRFTFIYLFIYLFIVIVFPWYIGDEFFNIQKAHIAILLIMVYLVFSLFLIFYKSLKKE